MFCGKGSESVCKILDTPCSSSSHFFSGCVTCSHPQEKGEARWLFYADIFNPGPKSLLSPQCHLVLLSVELSDRHRSQDWSVFKSQAGHAHWFLHYRQEVTVNDGDRERGTAGGGSIGV